ncbi:polysaccharide biosynthesis protein [Sphingomonas sp. CFBP 13728]|nr:polysaccharide biosynthesis protein [Sphingomonas sp. CFBP 13728]
MLTDRLLELPRPAKRLIALGIDSLICVASVWTAFYLRLGEWPPLTAEPSYPVLVSIALALPIFVSFGLYRAIFRYAGNESAVAVARAVVLYSVPFSFIYTFVGVASIPRTIGLIQPILLLVMIGGSRALGRILLHDSYLARWRAIDVPRVVIYGAGSAGRQLASAILSSNEMRLVGFIDDNPSLRRATMSGVAIHGPNELGQLVTRRSVSHLLLAIPSATRARRTEIMHQLHELNLKVRTVPSFVELARGNITVSDLRELDIEDLLGRPAVPPDEILLRRNIAQEVVLVTGAGGSIGSELCRQILQARPALLLLFESSEFNLYTLHQELTAAAIAMDLAPGIIVPLLGSVGDERRVEEVMATWQPNTVFHAAAYKHVPLVEHNVIDGVRNNVLGTWVLAHAARRHSVANFLLVSTDKAVRPTNVMGATKRMAEMILQALQQDNSSTCFSMVRFGNVLGSSGSVVPLFRRQLAAGGPLTVTHKDITRYFMTITEAAQLVVQAGAMARGGDVFVLDMGDPVRVIDLARNIIELSGLTVRDETHPEGDIEIRVDGLRPGEKLFEELLIAGEPTPTAHPRILRSHEDFYDLVTLKGLIRTLCERLDKGDAASVRDMLTKIVLEYVPNSPLVDHVVLSLTLASPRVSPLGVLREGVH